LTRKYARRSRREYSTRFYADDASVSAHHGNLIADMAFGRAMTEGKMREYRKGGH